MINSDRINKWLALVANLGILVGIIFVGLEIQQNTRAAKISSLDSTLSQYNHFREHIIRDREVAEIWEHGIAEEKLDGPDSTRFDMLVRELMFTIQAVYLRSREAAITEDVPSTMRPVIETYMRYPGIHKWWLTNSRGRFTSDFSKYVDDILDDRVEGT